MFLVAFRPTSFRPGLCTYMDFLAPRRPSGLGLLQNFEQGSSETKGVAFQTQSEGFMWNGQRQGQGEDLLPALRVR